MVVPSHSIHGWGIRVDQPLPVIHLTAAPTCMYPAHWTRVFKMIATSDMTFVMWARVEGRPGNPSIPIRLYYRIRELFLRIRMRTCVLVRPWSNITAEYWRIWYNMHILLQNDRQHNITAILEQGSNIIAISETSYNNIYYWSTTRHH
jgi:hypothetical protein